MTALLITLAAVASIAAGVALCALILNGAIVLLERIDEWLERRSP